MRPRSKYGATKTAVDGIVFHSKREAARYQELKLLEKAGEIRGLRLQPSFALMVPVFKNTAAARENVNHGVVERISPVGEYRADFSYEEQVMGRWRKVVEDTKGFKTAMYALKKRMVERMYEITIRET